MRNNHRHIHIHLSPFLLNSQPVHIHIHAYIQLSSSPPLLLDKSTLHPSTHTHTPLHAPRRTTTTPPPTTDATTTTANVPADRGGRHTDHLEDALLTASPAKQSRGAGAGAGGGKGGKRLRRLKLRYATTSRAQVCMSVCVYVCTYVFVGGVEAPVFFVASSDKAKQYSYQHQIKAIEEAWGGNGGDVEFPH